MEELTILDMQGKMALGEETSRSYTQMYLNRIAQYDGETKAVIEPNPDALEQADALDLERQEKGMRSALHGIPVLIKDNIDTADKMMTTAGSLALLGSIAAEDAFLVSRLREAGAVILGKTNLSEWANFRSTRSSSGWSSRGGQTRNPYALDRSPSGSSSGSGVAVSANLCAVAVGTETDGSVVSPAQANGIVGIKPTLGLVSRSGIIPIAHSQDTAGAMARTVKDAAVLLGVMVGSDPKDKATQEADAKGHRDYVPFLDANGLQSARIGVARNLFGFSDRVDGVMEGCLEIMCEAGAELIDVTLETVAQLGKTELEVLHTEFKADLNAYLSRLSADVKVRSLEDIIRYNEEHAEEMMPYFGQEHMLTAQGKEGLTGETYLKALETNHRLARKEGIDGVLEKHKLEAIIAPSGSPAWLIDWVNGDHYIGGSSSLAAVAGYPNITVPAGFIFGLPVGISFFGGAYQEPTLIKLAFAFEQATKVRRPPQFLPTAPLRR